MVCVCAAVVWPAMASDLEQNDANIISYDREVSRWQSIAVNQPLLSLLNANYKRCQRLSAPALALTLALAIVWQMHQSISSDH